MIAIRIPVALSFTALVLSHAGLAADASTSGATHDIADPNTPPADPGDAVTGVWLTAGKDCRIEIKRSKNGKYDGKIAWLKEPYEPSDDGEAREIKRDINNPDKSKRNEPLVGLALLKNFAYTGENVWSGGTIYDPENGKTYKCQMTLTDPKRLDVRGYIGIRAFGRTTAWTRYEAPEKKPGQEEDPASQATAPDQPSVGAVAQ